ncbi:hypothetical protein Syun_005293 [Stephania yunnanensis]|uniref:NAD-dependent epimerase/dehydratase domain-containing protein n=1 Tax=Stephania yunnanensis TaxID=152371 RepID=A0AAP0L4U1_9MAGN
MQRMCTSTAFKITCVNKDDRRGSNQMIISITGATGFIGRRLVRKLHSANNFPGILIAEESEWNDCIRGSNGVVNLAGMSISTRWSSEVWDAELILNRIIFTVLLNEA